MVWFGCSNNVLKIRDTVAALIYVNRQQKSVKDGSQADDGEV